MIYLIQFNSSDPEIYFQKLWGMSGKHTIQQHWGPNRMRTGYFCTNGEPAKIKGLRMVARALWRSEARRVVHWSETSRRRMQGRSQGTTLSASGLHSARAIVLNPFCNMEYKTITKIRENMTWIETDILGINLNRYNALAPAIDCVSTIPFNSVTSQ